MTQKNKLISKNNYFSKSFIQFTKLIIICITLVYLIKQLINNATVFLKSISTKSSPWRSSLQKPINIFRQWFRVKKRTNFQILSIVWDWEVWLYFGSKFSYSARCSDLFFFFSLQIFIPISHIDLHQNVCFCLWLCEQTLNIP